MFEELLRKTAQVLDGASVPYVIMGGQAALLYGVVRVTQDIDVTLGVSAEELPRVLLAVAEAGWRVLPENPERFVAATNVLPLQDLESGIRLDLIFSFTPFEREAISRAIPVEVDGVSVAFVRLEDLVIFKVFAGRARDLEDVRALLLRHPEVNRAYIREWLGVMSEGAEASFLERFDSIGS